MLKSDHNNAFPEEHDLLTTQTYTGLLARLIRELDEARKETANVKATLIINDNYGQLTFWLADVRLAKQAVAQLRQAGESPSVAGLCSGEMGFIFVPLDKEAAIKIPPELEELSFQMSIDISSGYISSQELYWGGDYY